MRCNCLFLLVKGLIPFLISEHILLALIGEWKMVHEIDVVIVSSKSESGCAHSRAHTS